MIKALLFLMLPICAFAQSGTVDLTVNCCETSLTIACSATYPTQTCEAYPKPPVLTIAVEKVDKVQFCFQGKCATFTRSELVAMLLAAVLDKKGPQ